MDQSALDAIMESPVGVDIAYHLGKNPQDVALFKGVSDLAAIRLIGKFETRFESAQKPAESPVTPPTPSTPAIPSTPAQASTTTPAAPAQKPKPAAPVSAAPKPITPVSGRATAGIDLSSEDLPYQDFKAERERQLAARRRR